MPFSSLHRSWSSSSWIDCYVFPVSLVLQICAAVHISYYRRKYQQQDNQVFVIQLRSLDNENVKQQPEQNHEEEVQELNTSKYNKILFEVKNMIIFAVVLIIFFLLWYGTSIYQKNEQFSIIYYLQDFLAMFIFNVIFPCVFFLCNRKARVYIKELVCCS